LALKLWLEVVTRSSDNKADTDRGEQDNDSSDESDDDDSDNEDTDDIFREGPENSCEGSDLIDRD